MSFVKNIKLTYTLKPNTDYFKITDSETEDYHYTLTDVDTGNVIGNGISSNKSWMMTDVKTWLTNQMNVDKNYSLTN